MMRRTAKKVDPRDYQLTGDARTGYTYFVNGNADAGYQWMLVDRDGETLCSSELFAHKADCHNTLRAVQRHAATTHIIDEAISSPRNPEALR